MVTQATEIQSLTQEAKDQLKKRHPEHFASFEANPPADLFGYVQGMTGGKYCLAHLDNYGYSVVFPQEKNREIVGGNGPGGMSDQVHSILHWLWARWDRLHAFPQLKG